MAGHRLARWAGITALAVVAVACGNTTEAGDGRAASIVADGSSTVFPITQAVAEEFNVENPDVQVSVGTSGTGGGFEKFCAGEIDLADASRPIKPDEEAPVCERNGVEYVELQVAIDGLSILVHPGNRFVDCLTLEELAKIWGPGSTIDSWSQVRNGFPDLPLTLYGPGTDSGTFDYFTDEVNGEEGASRSDYTASEDDNVLVQGIAGDPNALGYFGYAYVEQNRDKLKTVAVDGGAGCVQPTVETIASGDYSPLSRPLFVYVSRDSAERPEVRDFLTFYLTTVNDLVSEVGYIPMPQDIFEAERDEWERFAA